mmetsp:Transcript_9046/g.12527  ORF Transcript_9046/g.12527 Transcript_9046/m.12527 type:complete len:756 (-) Transcript_9046:425-2692(-)|eukprot:CAMPEP_0185732024 /NCGR_PEP_ID=MMETSP1171-20130828/14697_1 /TAXON_ID=374046 /ORGANISM="Helicotheca tamensis, Strain CCMP826" /LENGTH=755 /DNA_ID=CAMNT_0028401407 /DNA_START=77 /DNA_END=2344 /DNA_ORIENTATION=+
MLRYAYSKRPQILASTTVGTVSTLVYFTNTETEQTFLEPKLSSPLNNNGRPPTAHHKTSSTLPTRDQQLSRLSKEGEIFDVLVIGGGATGSGVALDAQMRGLKTALIERADFSSETSSRSTKLIWAGIRYIATAVAQLLSFRTLTSPIDSVNDFVGEFKMVLGAHKERRILLENNPHLTNWVPIAVPMKSWVQWPPPFNHPLFSIAPVVFPGVMKFYDSLSGFSCPPSHLMMKKRAKRKFPQLDEDVKYVQVFYEGQHNDARTATCIALTAAEEGATVSNYTEMVGIIRENGDSGQAVGIKCRDNLTGKEFEVRSKAIIFAGGPFTDGMRKLEDPDAKPAVAGAAGTHIVLPGYYCAAGIGLLDINTSDGRFLFFLPWQGSTLVGTTDRKGDAVSSPGPPEDEIQWLLNEAEKYLANDLKVRRADVLSAWQGFRPLASDPNAPPGAPVSRDHIISTNPDTGITFITGGKWTTYREMAEDVLDRVIKMKGLSEKAGPCATEERPLRGGVGYTRNLSIRLVQEFGVSEETAKHLASTYGMNAFDVCKMTKPSGKRWPRFGNLLIEGYPYLECEVEYACKYEMTCTVTDMLTLRTRLAYLNSSAAIEVAPKVAELMAKSLGWSKAEKNRQLAEAVEALSEFGGPIPQKEGSKLSAATITDIRSLFHVFDQDQNGFIDFEEMKLMAKELGSPFESEKEALKTFKRMDVDNTGRIYEERFVEWWHDTGRDDKLRKDLGESFKFSADKLKRGTKSRGAMFG